MTSFYKYVRECHRAEQPRQATIDNFQSKMICILDVRNNDVNVMTHKVLRNTNLAPYE